MPEPDQFHPEDIPEPVLAAASDAWNETGFSLAAAVAAALTAMREQTSQGDELDRKLSDLPAHVRNNPMFRRGYTVGLSDLVFARQLAERDAAPRSAEPVPASARANSFDVTAVGLRGRLGEGDVVVRDLLAFDDNGFVTETPCCGRRVSAPRDQDASVVCCRCKVLATVTMTEEEPDGFSDERRFVAVFTVISVGVVVAQHRAGRWER